MTGDSESVSGEKDGGSRLIAQIPVGWQRKVQEGAVAYISPSGTVLGSLEQVRVYLRTDGTCKCGLECPLVPNKVFNFDMAATLQAPGHQSGKLEQDMTKLCNHRRKVDAMAALCQSMQPGRLTPLPPPSGSVVCSLENKDSRGPTLPHGDTAHCTYPPSQPNPLKPSLSFPLASSRAAGLQNGCVNLSMASRAPEQASHLKKSSFYPKQQWSPGVAQRTSPSTVKPSPPDTSHPLSPSASARPYPQGYGGKCPLSPSRDSFSPHQRSRHSSTSSEHGSALMHKPSLPMMPCSSPQLPLSPCGRVDGVLLHYSDCGSQTSQMMASVGDKRNGVTPGLIQLPLGSIKSHISSSFPASSLLSAAAKAQVANQKTLVNTSDGLISGQEESSKVSLSTLNSRVHSPSTKTPPIAAILLPKSPPLSPSSLSPETNLRRKRQRRSPGVLSALREPLNPALYITPPPASTPPNVSHPPLRVPDPSLNPSQPLSALLQLLSMQNASQQQSRHTHSSPPSPGTAQAHNGEAQSSVRLLTPAPPHAPEHSTSQGYPLIADETTLNLKTSSSNGALNLSQPHVGTTSDLCVSILSLMNQMSSNCHALPERGAFLDPLSQSTPEGSKDDVEDPERQLDPDPVLPLHPPETPPHSTDPGASLALAEAFPFMSQEQLLSLLSSHSGLPSLLPPFLGPLGLWSQSQALLNQSELPLNLVSLLQPLSAAPPVESGEKTALLMASLLFGNGPGALVPLNAEQAQQVLEEAGALEKAPALMDPVLMAPALLEALQSLGPTADGQSMMLSASLAPPGFLSLTPALLAAALAQNDPPLPSHSPSPPQHSQGPPLVSTSASPGQEVGDSLAEQDRSSPTHHFLPPLLAPEPLGELSALGNIGALHGLLGAAPLALNPLTCLQLAMAPGLLPEKPGALNETPPMPEDPAVTQNPLLSPAPPREPALFDPYASFMDTIYTSFLQVSERGSCLPPAPPSLSPRHACSLTGPDLALIRPGLETAPSPARGTPKLSQDPPATPPPPIALPTVNHNGFCNGRSEGGEEEEECVMALREEEEEERDQELQAGDALRRKRKQTFQGGLDLSGGLHALVQDPAAAGVLSRSSGGKRRRVPR